MTVPEPSTKKALLVAVRQVKAESRLGDLPELDLAHRDARDLCEKLISLHEYQPGNIILMLDDKDHPSHLWPTRKKILSQAKKLIRNAPENCHITFYFSGHCVTEECQSPERVRMRADGRDSEIVCADGLTILDYELHKYLVEPLENVKGSKLFTLFDCCHSENLLDLQRGKHPNFYSRVWSIGAGQLFKDVAIAIARFLKLNRKYAKEVRIPQPIRRASTELISPSRSSTLEVGKLSVICLSACRDRQLAYDDRERGDTFTRCFIDATSTLNVTWEGVRNELQQRILDIVVRCEESVSLASSEVRESHVHWTQDPRLITNPWTDLRQVISL